MENGKIMPSGFLEEEVYEVALLELQSGNIRKGLWAKAFSESEGNEAKSQALYIKLRVQQEKERIQQEQIVADKNVENLKVADFCYETNQKREEKNIKDEKNHLINFTNPIVLKLIISSALTFLLISYINPENFSISDISTSQKFGFFVAEHLGYSIIPFLLFYFSFFRKKGKSVVQVAFICITISTMFGLFFNTNPKYKSNTITKIYNNKKAIANLPVMTDSYTRLDDISLNGSELIYKYTYINIKKDHANFLDFSDLNLELNTKICSNQTNRKALEEGAVFTKSFYGIDGSHLNTFSVSLENCSR